MSAKIFATTQIDGDDPHIYSKKIPTILPYSFLRMNNANTFSEEEQKQLPNTECPTYMNPQELHGFIFSNKAAILHNLCLGMNREEGHIEYLNADEEKQMTSLMLKMAAKLGKNIFTLNIVNFSLPCEIFEPRSDVDRIAELVRTLSIPLMKAWKTNDKLERMKLITANLAGSGYILLRKKKAMNPYLGETCQAKLDDGTDISVEQISHHPPITAFYFVGPEKAYTVSGTFSFEGSFKVTYLLIDFCLKMNFRFKDGHEIKIIRRPKVKIEGIVKGSRYVFLKGFQEIIDASESLRSILFFDIGEKKHLIGSAKTATRDCVEGIIYLSSDINKPTDMKVRRISELKDIKEEKAKIKGSWFDKIDINDMNYWHIDKHLPMKMSFVTDPLPSDWRYREDLLFIRRKDIPRADIWKDACEIRQRKDKALREKFLKKYFIFN